MGDITIFHNPACGTSRNVLAMIRNSGVEPTVIDYLKTPPGREELVELLAPMQRPVRDLLRRKGTPYDELKLDDPAWTDLPRFGLAFAVDAEHREWTITKATPGDGLEGLGVGSSVQLQLIRHKHQELVSEYRRTD